jgi:hypothetical protein
MGDPSAVAGFPVEKLPVPRDRRFYGRKSCPSRESPGFLPVKVPRFAEQVIFTDEKLPLYRKPSVFPGGKIPCYAQ